MSDMFDGNYILEAFEFLKHIVQIQIYNSLYVYIKYHIVPKYFNKSNVIFI